MKNFQKLLLLLFLLLQLPSPLKAGGTAGEQSSFESNYIVDMPTAGILAKGYYALYMNFFSGGGLATEFVVAPFTNVNFGIGYSGENVIGSGDILSPDIPSFNIKVRVFDEKMALPALVVGLNTLGRGPYSRGSKRFDVMSPGVFIAASKSFESLLGFSYVHAGIGYSLEPLPHERKPNLYLGAEQTIGPMISVNGELNFNFHETHLDLTKKAIFNASLRFSPTSNITLELQMRDLLKNLSGYGIERGFVIEFTKDY